MCLFGYTGLVIALHVTSSFVSGSRSSEYMVTNQKWLVALYLLGDDESIDWKMGEI